MAYGVSKSQPADDDLFLALDKELEDFLTRALDVGSSKIERDELQNTEGSGESQLITPTGTSHTTHEPDSQLNTTMSSSPRFGASSDEANRETVQVQPSFSTVATQTLSEPEVARTVADRIVETNLDEFLNSTAESLQATSGVSTQSITTINFLTTQTDFSFFLTTSATPTTIAERMPQKIVRDANHTVVGCIAEATCYSDSDCEQGVCLGALLGKCNCHACVANANCENDSNCGGLRKACQDGICRCAHALALHGFPLYIEALTKFCSQRTCLETTDSCFGLPCGRGICSCN
ncbi:hypothetical protein NECAME_16470 [Necator americanus]|uniref:Uncharacterized protein n=1 Tax=Necator americanus TaxID=51031 RepID=W2TYM4_NECAM|nr:hypothetical protein NECAME_16470 [Necator americanus]ETN86132.1 hypothetical protein NECAME_16470 [Necator americanus]